MPITLIDTLKQQNRQVNVDTASFFHVLDSIDVNFRVTGVQTSDTDPMDGTNEAAVGERWVITDYDERNTDYFENLGAVGDGDIVEKTGADTWVTLVDVSNTLPTNNLNDTDEGILVYAKDKSSFYFYNGTAWVAMGASGTDGDGWTGVTYNSVDGKLTFTSDDDLGFTSPDIRGADGTDGTDGTDASAVFKTIAIQADSGFTWAAGDIVADAVDDTLVLVNGANIALATDTSDDNKNAIRITATYSAFTGAVDADPEEAGTVGLVPAPAAGEHGKFLKGDGTWDTVSGGASHDAVTLATVTGNYLSKDSGQVITAGTVPISLGGTGAVTATAARAALGAGTGDGAVSFNGTTADGLVTYASASTGDVEANLTFDGTTLFIDSGDLKFGNGQNADIFVETVASATDAAGLGIQIKGGKGRGTGKAGPIDFLIAHPVSTGTTVNNWKECVSIRPDTDPVIVTDDDPAGEGGTTQTEVTVEEVQLLVSDTGGASHPDPTKPASLTISNKGQITTKSGIRAYGNSFVMGPTDGTGVNFIANTGGLGCGNLNFRNTTTNKDLKFDFPTTGGTLVFRTHNGSSASSDLFTMEASGDATFSEDVTVEGALVVEGLMTAPRLGAITSKTADATLSATDRIVWVDGGGSDATITMPAWSNGRVIEVYYGDEDQDAAVAEVRELVCGEPSALSGTSATYISLKNGSNAQRYIWFNTTGSLTDPAPGGTGIEINTSGFTDSADTAEGIASTVNADGDFSATQGSGADEHKVTISNLVAGTAHPNAAINDGSFEWSISTTTNGTNDPGGTVFVTVADTEYLNGTQRDGSTVPKVTIAPGLGNGVRCVATRKYGSGETARPHWVVTDMTGSAVTT